MALAQNGHRNQWGRTEPEIDPDSQLVLTKQARIYKEEKPLRQVVLGQLDSRFPFRYFPEKSGEP